MDYIKDIWAGYIQSFATDVNRPALLIVDFLLVGIAVYFFLQLLNSQRGWRYIGLFVGLILILIGSSLFHLPGLHLIAQGGLIMSIILLPIIFQAEFTALFQGNAASAPISTANRTTLIATAVVIAGLVVIAASGVSTKTAELPGGVPIVATNLASGLSANFGSQRSVTVVVSASRQTWKGLTADSFSATIDVAKQAAGSYDLPVSVTSKVAGVEIRRVSPKRVAVIVESVIKKTVPVVVKFTGRAGNELVADTPVINPDKVEITGAKSVIADLTQVLAPIKLDDETATISRTVALVALDSSGKEIPQVTISPPEVLVTVPLVKSGKIKAVGVQATITGTPAAGYWVKSVALTPSVVSVTGNVDVLEALTAIPTQSISVAGLSADKTVQVELQLPSGITLSDSTKKITAKITVEKTSTTKSITPELVYKDVDSSLQVSSTSPTSITAQVSGPTSQLAAMSDSSVKINLEMSAYKSAGTYSITIKNSDFTFPDGIGLVSFLPSVISVTLSNK